MKLIALASILACPSLVYAISSSRGGLGIETRFHRDDEEPLTEDASVALLGRLEWSWVSESEKARFNVRAIGRADSLDQNRSRAFLEEAFGSYDFNYFKFTLGARILNWSTAEAFHPSDVMNSRNWDSPIENPEKIGEPLASLEIPVREGTLSGYFMPVRIRPFLPDGTSRMSFFPAGLRVEEPRWVNSSGLIESSHFEPQFALRATQTLGPLDLSVHHIRHEDRSEPKTLIEEDAFGLYVRPLYFWVNQTGATATAVFEEWILKTEIVYRNFSALELSEATSSGVIGPSDHGVLSFGVERGIGFKTGSELSLISEFQSILAPTSSRQTLSDPFQRDVLLGGRFAFNDESSRELLATAIVDAEFLSETLWNFSYTQRIAEVWTLSAGARIYTVSKSGNAGLTALTDSDHILFSIIRNF